MDTTLGARDERRARVVAGSAGIAGSVLLGLYFSAPLPVPAASATSGQVLSFAELHHTKILLGGWLQATGSALGVVFFVALAQLSRGGLARSIVKVGSAALLALSLVEATLLMDVAEASRNGHPASAVTSFDIQTVFVHPFLTVAAPLVYLGTAVLLRGSRLLAKGFWMTALALAACFEVLGFVGLFARRADQLAVIVLIAQAVWILSAAVVLLRGTRRLITPAL